MAREIELKLAFPAHALTQIQRHSLIAATTPRGRAETLVNTYYDTPEQSLGKALVALRTRRIGRRWLQTVKSAHASAGGLSSRPEWEQPYDSRAKRFDFSGIDDPATLALLEEHADRIAPLFTTTFRRETREYAPREGVRILVMIDSGVVHLGAPDSPDSGHGPRASISELELELAEGSADDLFDYALELARELPLMPEDVSKAQRGYRLLRGETPRAVRGVSADLTAGMSPRQAFLAYALQGLQAWQANALGAISHEDPEFIHQLRIALRRLRTLLRLFERELPDGFAADWQEQLGELAQQVGRARDLDVMRESLLEEAAAAEGAPDFQPLLAHLEGVSSGARHEARERLLGGPSRVLLLAFGKALHGLASTAQTPGSASESLEAFATQQLSKLRKRVKTRLAAAVESEDAADLHRVRIALKRLRYALEFFSPLMKKKAAKNYLRELSAVLHRLGHINDVAVGTAQLQRWATDHEALCQPVMWASAWHAALAERRARRAQQRVADFLELSPPWKKSRNLLSLK